MPTIKLVVRYQWPFFGHFFTSTTFAIITIEDTMQRVTESQYIFREMNKVGRDLLRFKVGITHFIHHINFLNQ